MVLLSERAKPNPSKKIMSNEFRLPGIVPWGRTAKEYEQFFRLQDLVPGARLLDCGGGPSSFASEYRERGFWAVSADPLFASSASAIEESFAQAIDIMMSGLERAKHRFVWDYYPTPEVVLELRKAAVTRVLGDLRRTPPATSYVAASLPQLPFADGSFDIALCSHLLFLYSEDLSVQFHCESLRELLRVAREVQVFPLLDMHGDHSCHLPAVVQSLQNDFWVESVAIDFQFQKGADQVLRIRRHPAG